MLTEQNGKQCSAPLNIKIKGMRPIVRPEVIGENNPQECVNEVKQKQNFVAIYDNPIFKQGISGEKSQKHAVPKGCAIIPR
jgi:hypothetical protein